MDKKKLSESILYSVFLAFTIGVYAPLSIYCANAGEYWYTLRLIWYVPAFVFLVMTVILSSLAFFSKGLFYNIFIGVEMGVGICLYVQGNFLNLKVGTFNGARIDWSIYKRQMVLNAFIWVAIIALSVTLIIIKSAIMRKVYKYLAAILTTMQLASFVFLIVPTIQNEGFSIPSIPTFTKECLYEAGEENIIVIIVDMLDERFVDYALEEFPESRDVFDGFEFYDNFTSQYHGTNLSLGTSFVSGKYYHNEKPFYEWVEDSAEDRLYFDELEENGYGISVYTEEVACFPKRVREKIINYVEVPKKFYNVRTCFSLLYRSAGCVYFPDALKPYIWMSDAALQGTDTIDGAYSIYTDNDTSFKNGIEQEGITVKDGTKQFKLIHLRGMHEPYYVDEWGGEAAEHWNWEIAMKSSVRIMGEYFEKLKEQEIYDNSTIVVTGDHGYHCTRGVISSPAFLMKEKNRRGEITTNSNEAGLVNLAATIADLSGAEDTTPYGLSILDIDENTDFERFLYNSTYDADGVTVSKGLLEYRIPKDTNEKFILTGIEYTGDGTKIDHKEYCITCRDHIGPVMEYKWLVDLHRHTADYPY